MTESTALTTTTSNNQALAFLHDGAALDHRYRLAKAFSGSRVLTVPIAATATASTYRPALLGALVCRLTASPLCRFVTDHGPPRLSMV